MIPDTRVGWREALSAVFTAVLFTIGRMVLGIYRPQGDDSITDAADRCSRCWCGVYSAQLVLFGAEFTVVMRAGRIGRRGRRRRAPLPVEVCARNPG